MAERFSPKWGVSSMCHRNIPYGKNRSPRPVRTSVAHDSGKNLPYTKTCLRGRSRARLELPNVTNPPSNCAIN